MSCRIGIISCRGKKGWPCVKVELGLIQVVADISVWLASGLESSPVRSAARTAPAGAGEAIKSRFLSLATRY